MQIELTTLDRVGELIESRRLEEASTAVGSIAETEDNRTELMFLRAYIKEQSFDLIAAAEAYEAVLTQDPDHTETAFRLAILADRFGDNDQAISLYEQCVAQQPAHVNALVNLAVLYEDRGDLQGAESCLSDVLYEDPNHPRARSYIKSVRSSYTMIFDEQTQKERERRSAILDMPISDFELSVRSRNCLRQMNIRTLGDLLRTTEYQLLSYKNFGETSLNEIKAMLTQKGLRLGQGLEPVEVPAPAETTPAVSGEVVARTLNSVSDLELSVRSRKALQRLGISTLGELTIRSEAELLSIKNFGQTSLNEIRQQLARFGLDLRESGQ